MACATPCKQCSRSGLPILFTRYAVAYHHDRAHQSALARCKPVAPMQETPGNVPLKTAAYNVRMLRAGYLYLVVERNGPPHPDDSLAYAVHPQGFLTAFPIGTPGAVQTKEACDAEMRMSNNSLVYLAQAETIKTLWYCFHPDPLEPAVYKQMRTNPPKYGMQRFDVAGWLSGQRSAEHSAAPDKLDATVVEFAALKDKALRDACDPLLFGLMGSNPQERAWGDYTVVAPPTAYFDYSPMAVGPGQVDSTMTVEQPAYDVKHGRRLGGMGKLLRENKDAQGKASPGAILACHDPMGMAQELGHLFAEAQVPYLAWQEEQAAGLFHGVSNLWATQAAALALATKDLAKAKAERDVDATVKAQEKALAPLAATSARSDAARRLRNDVNRSRAEKRALLEKYKAQHRADDPVKVDTAWARFIDPAQAESFMKANQTATNENQKRIDVVAADHLAILGQGIEALRQLAQRYDTGPGALSRSTGAGALARQAAAALIGLEASAAGRQWIAAQWTQADNLCAWTLMNTSPEVRAEHKKALAQLEEASRGLPAQPADDAVGDLVAKGLKGIETWWGYGDKALAGVEAGQGSAAASAFARSYSANVMTLGSVMAVETARHFRSPNLEYQLARLMLRSGLAGLGSTATELQAKTGKGGLAGTAQAIEGAVNRTTVGAKLVREGRVPLLNALVQFGQGIAKLSRDRDRIAEKLDGRALLDSFSSLMGGVGEVLGYRAKVFEETVLKGTHGVDLYGRRVNDVAKELAEAHWMRLKVTAFKFAGPALLIGVALDAVDFMRSRERLNRELARGQFASAAGGTFAFFGLLATTFGWGEAVVIAAAVLNIVAAVLIIAGFALTLAFSQDKWIDWLQDCPLNRERAGKEPLHHNLRETLECFVAARAELVA